MRGKRRGVLRQIAKTSLNANVAFPVLSILASLGLWLTTLHTLSNEQKSAERVLWQSSRQWAETYETHHVRSLQWIDQYLKTAKYAYEQSGDDSILYELDQYQLLPPPLIFTIALIGEEGETITSHGNSLASITSSIPVWENADDEMQVTIVDRDGLVVQLSRRLSSDTSTEARRVAIEVAPDFFVSSYNSSQLGEKGLLSAVSVSSDWAIWRSGDRTETGELNVYPSRVRELAPGESTTFLARSPIDGIERLTTIRRLSDFPVAVIVGLSRAEQLKAVEQRAEKYLTRALMANFLLFALVGLLWSTSSKLSKSRQQQREIRRAYQQELKQMAFHDGLTGLPNRLLFSNLLANSIRQARRDNDKMALLFLDLDGFKQVNDTLGHSAGDQLLQEFAERLKNQVRESDIVARISGDEFLALLPSITRKQDAFIVANKIKAAVNRPFEALNGTLSVTVSIGISIFPDDGANDDTLLRHADEAMYRSKTGGKNRATFYGDGSATDASTR